jgi:hypothetical protein
LGLPFRSEWQAIMADLRRLSATIGGWLGAQNEAVLEAARPVAPLWDTPFLAFGGGDGIVSAAC